MHTAHSAVVHLGPGSAADKLPTARLHSVLHDVPCIGPWLASRALRSWLWHSDPTHAQCILHAWSPAAAHACIPLVGPRHRLIIEVETAQDVTASVVWPVSGALADTPIYVVQSETAQTALLHHGVPANCVHVIPGPWPDPHAFDAAQARRADIRQRLGLAADHRVVLPLPPVARATGAYYAAWATLLAQKILPDLRLLIPASPRETDRIRYLVASTRHAYLASFPAPNTPLVDLLAAADLAIYLPTQDANPHALHMALAAACPLIASNTPRIRAALASTDAALLSPPRAPDAIAQVILTAFENPTDTRERAARARDLLTRLSAAHPWPAAYLPLIAG